MPRSSQSIFSRLALMCATILIFSALAFGQAETILHDFIELPHGGTPQAPVVADSAGNLYGTTTYGGLYRFGTVFKLSSGSNGKWTQTVLYHFTDQLDGAIPTAGLVLDAAGNLYGTVSVGGAICMATCYSGGGAVFKLSPNSDGTWSESTLYSFGTAGDGYGPAAGLTFDNAGNLYGTTTYGGTGGYGTVFELSPSSSGWTESILLNFTDETDGGNPIAGVTLDAAGNLYGTATVGGDLNCDNFDNPPYGCGVVFKLTHSNGVWTESVLKSFLQYDGAFPNGNVIFDASGNLVGTTVTGPGSGCGEGCGTVFQLTPGSNGAWTFKSVYGFSGGLDGATPQSGLVLGADGNFYGTTAGGGDANNCQYGCGTLFSLTPTKTYVWKEKIIHHFSGSATNPYGLDGSDPVAGVVFDQFGNLYGTAKSGGAAGSNCNDCSGTVFKLSKNSSGQWVTSQLYAFVASGDGLSPSGYPTSAPVSGTSGNLFGTTQYGGAYGRGAVYELIAQSGGGFKERVIYSFQGLSDGSTPLGGLVADSAGNLYGATYVGGVNSQCTFSYGCGTIFELSPASGGKWTLQTLHALSNTDGVSVNEPLTFDANENLIGTSSGNNQGTGLATAFQLSPSSSGWTFSLLHTFTGNDVFVPGGPVILDSYGNWFGVGAGGNKSAGVAYELSPSSGYTTTVLHSFAGGADGTYPAAPLVNHNGVLIGVTYEGGSTAGPCLTYGCGTVFALAHTGAGWQKKTIYTFAGGTDASSPAYGLTSDAAGNVYGSSWAGGASTNCGNGNGSGGCGTIFKLNQSGGVWSESVLYDFGLVPYDITDPATLLWTSNNTLFGTGGGGTDGNGAVFEIDLNSAPQLSAGHSLPPPPQWHPLHAASTTQSGKGGN